MEKQIKQKCEFCQMGLAFDKYTNQLGCANCGFVIQKLNTCFDILVEKYQIDIEDAINFKELIADLEEED